MKKLLAMLLCLVLAFSLLTACGDDDDDDSKGAKKNKVEEVDSVSDAIEEITKNDGTGTAVITMNCDVEGYGKINYEINCASDGKNMAMGLKMSVKSTNGEAITNGLSEVSVDIPELIIIKNNSLFINLGDIVKVADKYTDGQISQVVDTKKITWFEIPLPDDLDLAAFKTDSADAQKACLDLINDIIKCGEEDGKKAKFTKVEQLAAVMNVVADFTEKTLPGLVGKIDSAAGIEAIGKIDYNKYATKLIDFYYNDAVKVVEAMGGDKRMVDQYVDMIKETDLQQYVDAYVEEAKEMLEDETAQLGDEEFKELAEQIREAAEEVKADTDSEGKFEMTVSADTKGSAYVVAAEAKVEAEGQKVSFDIEVSYDVSEPKISAPKNTCTIGDFADMISDIVASMH